MRCVWEISIRSPLRETPKRLLRNISKEMTFWRHLQDVSNTSQKDVFFVMSLRRLKNTSKMMSFVWRLEDASSISQKRCIFCDVSETSPKHLSQVFLIFLKYPTKVISCDLRRVITILDKIYVGALETLKKWNVFWEQCIDINQVYHEYQWADICITVLASQ